ncbi:MAG: glycosyltransferase family 4 protein [Chitinophagaceae bacterium]
MKIGFASRYDPTDKKTWSGTSYYTLQQLKRFGEVELFQYPLPKLLQEWLTTQKSINKRVFKKQTSVEFLHSYAKHFSRKLSADLRKRPVDILFVSASSQLIAFADTTIPIIYMTDATFQQLQGYYPAFSNLAGYNIRQGTGLDKKAFQKAAHCMLASDWCKASAINDYAIRPDKISVVPCGANLDMVPSANQLDLQVADRCNILFIGVEWERKGGDIALGTYRKIRETTPHATLHIIGCIPPADLSAEKDITVIPFLDKNKKEEFGRLHHIYLQSDFLLLPTRAECAGIVFSEASAYGIPSITTDTGGVCTYVRNGVNGFALPPDAGADTYAAVIKNILQHPGQLQALRKSSRRLYEEELNWTRWGNTFAKITEGLAHR